MGQVLRSSWALLLGIMLLMVGNGIQGTLLGVRGGIEGFSTLTMSMVMSAYFAGFLIGSRVAPWMIQRVGHVRVFAALASFISAALILFPVVAHPLVWIALRLLIGLCFCGVYVVAESWLNNAADNENRGQALSLYLVVQMIGIVSAQGLLAAGDPSGFILFIVPSVLVSISFAPILLSISPAPPFETTKPMSIWQVYRVSPLGFVGIFLMGGVYSGLFGMASVFGYAAGLNVQQISIFVAAIYVGGLLLQFPIGTLSDRMDRRSLIVLAAAIGAVASLVLAAGMWQGDLVLLSIGSFVIGGMANPLYALLLAYTNDYLEADDMAAASGQMLFVNGVGAVLGPLVTGWMMARVGPGGFFYFLAICLAALAAYGLYRMTQRASPAISDTGVYAPILPSATPVAVEVAQEVAIEAAEQAAGDDLTAA